MPIFPDAHRRPPVPGGRLFTVAT